MRTFLAFLLRVEYNLCMLFLEHIQASVKDGFLSISLKDKMGRDLSISQAIDKALNRLSSYLLDLELLVVRIVGFIPIHTFRWIIYKLAGVNLSPSAHLHMGTQFFHPSGVSIGSGTIVGQNCFLDGRDKLIIGDHVDIASDVMIYNSEHDIDSEDFRPVTAPVKIGDHVFIGPRAIILPGVTIEKGAVVAAGAVVSKDVAEYSVVGGVPAKVIKERGARDFHYRLGRARLFQ